MIVIRKRRIIFVLSCFVFSIFAFYLFQANNKYELTKETVSLPISNKVIVIDARSSERLMKEHKVQKELQKQK